MLLIEQYSPDVRTNYGANKVGLATNYPVNFGAIATFNAGIKTNIPTIAGHSVTAAINATATATPAQVATGYITSTSVAPTTITLPTGTALGAQLGAVQGTTLDLYIDNTSGANTVTMAVNTNAVLSDWNLQLTAATASVTPSAVTPLTFRSGVSGTAKYTIVFSSPTAYTFSRTA